MISTIVVCGLLSIVTAGYLPPYYGEHSNSYGNHDNSWGGYGGEMGRHSNGWGDSVYGGEVADKGYQGSKYGDKAHSDGDSYYANGAAHAENEGAYDSGARAAADEDGYRKYSYFTSGSGPMGQYQKGSYGSEGYDHEDSKSAHQKEANGGGFKKGYSVENAEHADAKAHYDSDASKHIGHDQKYSGAHHGDKTAGYEVDGHQKGYEGVHHGEGRHNEHH